ncbi:hypothetical protein PABY_23330 [Pyrodictium abyssi]|uniref:Uncharacterized protein n=1 Tax=Pyrodictium abyssi TaxID=54256 RepID=A0ABN6ZR88_9CREN|nr:hypothetical protein PABY_23330 [Pyrodictium abyssi]
MNGLYSSSRRAGRGLIQLYISSASPVELSLYLRSRGLGEDKLELLFMEIDRAIRMHTKPSTSQPQQRLHHSQ